MKNIFKLMIPCLAVAFSLISCNDTMDDKASIDAQYEKPSAASVTLASATAVDFQTINATGTVSGIEIKEVCPNCGYSAATAPEKCPTCGTGDSLFVSFSNVAEFGIQISKSQDFSGEVKTIIGDFDSPTFDITATGLEELTTYYVRSYVATSTAGILVSDVKNVTTPKAPIFPIDGDYIATEWDFNQDTGEWENGGQYEMSISLDKDDPTILNISNIWDGGMTVQGQYNADKGIVTVPNLQVIYVHAKYGDVWIRGVNSAVTGYTSAVQFQFTALGGKMQSTPMGAICAAGAFGYFYLTMEHK